MKKCQICGSNNTYKITRTEDFLYKDNIVSVENFSVIHCDNCKEEIALPASRARSLKILKKAKRAIDGI